MANRRFWLVILVMTLVFGMMSAVGCGAQNNSGIEGIWDFGNGTALKFEKGKVQVFIDGELVVEGTYTIKGDTLTMVVMGVTGENKFSIKGNTLTLSSGNETQTGTKIIQSSPVGKWEYESGNTRNNFDPEDIELFKDGTGKCDDIRIKWKVIV